jgi:hypothetical protein
MAAGLVLVVLDVQADLKNIPSMMTWSSHLAGETLIGRRDPLWNVWTDDEHCLKLTG